MTNAREAVYTAWDVKVMIFDFENGYMLLWKRCQQLECLGVKFASKADDLKLIQTQIERLACYLLKLHEEIAAFDFASGQVIQNQSVFVLTHDQQSLLKKLSDIMKQLFPEVVQKSFIIDQQPPQIIMTKTKNQNFADRPMRARFLLTRFLNGKLVND